MSEWMEVRQMLLFFERTGELSHDLTPPLLAAAMVEVFHLGDLTMLSAETRGSLDEQSYTWAARKDAFRELVGAERFARYNRFIDTMRDHFAGRLQPTSKALASGDDETIEKSRTVGIRRMPLDVLWASLGAMDWQLFREHLSNARTCGVNFIQGKPEEVMPVMDTPTEKQTRVASFPPGYISQVVALFDEFANAE